MDESHSSDPILKAIRSGDRTVVNQLYHRNRRRFLGWAAKHFRYPQADLLDVFQDAIVALYLQVVEEKVDAFQVSVDAYLLGIARRMLYKKGQKEGRIQHRPELPEHLFEQVLPEAIQKSERSHQQHLIEEGLRRLSPVCRKLLTLVYFFEHGMEVVADKMDYKDTDTAKAQHFHCKQKLAQIVRNLMKTNHG